GDVAVAGVAATSLTTGATTGALLAEDVVVSGDATFGAAGGAAGGATLRRVQAGGAVSAEATGPAGVTLDGVRAATVAATGPSVTVGFLDAGDATLTATAGDVTISAASAAADLGAGSARVVAAPARPAMDSGLGPVVQDGAADLAGFADLAAVSGTLTVDAAGAATIEGGTVDGAARGVSVNALDLTAGGLAT
ncbi:MAG: hypothetical protein AAFU61_17830, partial [Pseudomonadota bacterium]